MEIKYLKKQVNDNEMKIKNIKINLIKRLKKSNKKIGFDLEKEIFNFKTQSHLITPSTLLIYSINILNK